MVDAVRQPNTRLERALRVSGPVLAALFVPVAVALTLALLPGSTLVSGLFSTPQALIETLAEDGFYQRIAPAVLTTAFDSLPQEVTVGSVTLPLAPVVAALREAGWQETAERVISREWLVQQLAALAASRLFGDEPPTIASARRQIALIQERFTGGPAAELADFVLGAVRRCTQIETRRLLALRRDDTGLLDVVDFVCSPPLADVEAREVMRDLLVLAFAGVAANLADDVAEVVAAVGAVDLSLDTPLGRLSLVWPGVQLASGAFTVVYTLPADITEPVEQAASAARSALRAADERARREVEQARQDLLALRPQPVRPETPEPAPTPAPSPIAPPPTAAAGPVPVPGLLAGVSESLAGLTGPVSDAVRSLTDSLAQWGAAASQRISLVAGLLLLFTAVLALHLVRTVSGAGLWAGAVLLLSGAVLLLAQRPAPVDQAAAPLAETALPAAIAELRAAAADSLARAVEQQISGPLQTQGVVLLLGGAALAAGSLYLWWRARRA